MSSAMPQARCPHCGAVLPGQPRFCDQCGREIQPLARPPSAERTTLSGVRLPPLAVEPVASAVPTDAPARSSWLALAIVVAIAMLLLVLGWWQLRPESPAPPSPGVESASPPATVEAPASRQPTAARPAAEDVLADLRARRDRAHARYTEIAVGEAEGDIEVARAEFRAAQDALTAAEGRAAAPGD